MDNYQPYFNIADLIAKHLRGELTADDRQALDQWLAADPHNRELFQKLTEEQKTAAQLETFALTNKQPAWKNIAAKTGFKSRKERKSGLKRALPYAAAILLLTGFGLIIQRLSKKQQAPAIVLHKNDLLPGTNKAILTLADGSKILLDDAKKGYIARQRNVAIDKAQNGQLIYQLDGTASSAPDFETVVMNTLTTPRGGQYEVVLPDGTKVWLNAASSLTYPTLFNNKDRRVTLTGEAYFEVAKDASKPFFVKSAGQTVEVLGTHFNINSYSDEKETRTTLLEGSVKVTGAANRALRLVPGQQAVNNPATIDLNKNPDVDEILAWKNGHFMFRNTELKTIMRQISRWYDVDVEYQGAIAEKHYRGRISRNVPVSQVFEILNTSGVNFTINGRKIIVKS